MWTLHTCEGQNVLAPWMVSENHPTCLNVTRVTAALRFPMHHFNFPHVSSWGFALPLVGEICLTPGLKHHHLCSHTDFTVQLPTRRTTCSQQILKMCHKSIITRQRFWLFECWYDWSLILIFMLTWNLVLRVCDCLKNPTLSAKTLDGKMLQSCPTGLCFPVQQEGRGK